MGDLKGPLSNVQVVVVAARNSLFCVISTRRAREIVGHPWKCYGGGGQAVFKEPRTSLRCAAHFKINEGRSR